MGLQRRLLGRWPDPHLSPACSRRGVRRRHRHRSVALRSFPDDAPRRRDRRAGSSLRADRHAGAPATRHRDRRIFFHAPARGPAPGQRALHRRVSQRHQHGRSGQSSPPRHSQRFATALRAKTNRWKRAARSTKTSSRRSRRRVGPATKSRSPGTSTRRATRTTPVGCFTCATRRSSSSARTDPNTRSPRSRRAPTTARSIQ